MQKKSVAFHTLGCKLNYSETSTISRLLENDGFEKKDFDERADVYVLNTCSVTENADKECRQLVRRIQRRSPESLVVITGCYAQLKPKEIAEIPGVDLVLGANEKFNITQHLKELTKGNSAKISSCDIDEVQDFNASFSYNDRTRAFLKVQDGCDYNCSFCTIPMARGKSRSDTIENAVNNAKELALKGVKEIVLTGVNLGDFKEQGEKRKKQETSKKQEIRSKEEDARMQQSNIQLPTYNIEPPIFNFLDLVKAMDEVEGIERFRISSIEPNLLTTDIIEFVSRSKKFMPHFHIPLQSGSNKILGLMRRRYKRELYAERVALIKQLMPHCAIGVDVIVGFPSEDEKDFDETFQFIESLDVSYLHVFTYSERNNTKALDIQPVVPVNIRHERNKILRSLSYKKMEHFKNQQEGTMRKVLFEDNSKTAMMEGYTDNYIRVSTPYRVEWANKIIDWKI